MMRRAPILLMLFVLLTLAMVGCNTGGSTVDVERTIEAQVQATLEGAETAPTATQAPPEPTATPPPDIEAEEYAVYSAMIQQNPIGYNLGSFLVIKEQTVSDPEMFERTLEETRRLPTKLVDSYRSRNAAFYALGPNLDLEQDYALMPQEEFDRIFRRGGAIWPRFQDTYPEASGIVSFSRVGFGANEDMALVLMGYRCDDLCGAGGLYLLAKEEGNWKVQEALMEWMS
jgi:hypothetical protein